MASFVVVGPGRLTRRRAQRHEAAPFSLVIPRPFEICAGRKAVLSGPNGAGKTTLLAFLAGIPIDLSHVSAEAWLCNAQSREPLRRRTAFLPAEPSYFPAITVLKYLHLLRHRYAVAPGDIHEALDRFGLPREVWNRSPDTLSSGQRKRLGLARVWLQTEPVLVLDEPCEHLDARGVELVEALQDRAFREGRIVVIASHDASDRDRADVRLRVVPDSPSVAQLVVG